MNKRDEFLKEQKVLRLATVGKSKTPHIVPVWYRYSGKKFHIGTNTKTVKVKNVKKNNKVSCCVDVGINAPDIYGVLVKGNANLILDNNKVKTIAKKILLRYFKSLDNKSARELLDDTDCIIEVVPEKFTVWNY
jgi:general stress protein 26